MKKYLSTRFRDYLFVLEFIVMLMATPAFAGSPDYVTVVIENNGTYPVTFQLPTKVDRSDFNPMGGVPVFTSDTSPDVRTSVTVDGNQQVVLFMGLEKPVVNMFDILSKDWGFNLKFCIQDGPCDEARISGTIRSTRACGHSSEPNDAGYEMSHGEKVPRGFLVTSGDSSEVFDLAKETFDQMALFVEVAVVGNRGHTIGF